MIRRLWLSYLRTSMKVAMICGPLSLLLAIGCAAYTLVFLVRSIPGTGKVLDLKEQVDDHGDVTYAPIFQFTANDGKRYTIESLVYSAPAGFDIGEAVEIRYLSGHPTNARIKSYWQTWGLETILAVLGTIFTAIGFALRRWMRKKRWIDQSFFGRSVPVKSQLHRQ